MIVRGMNSRRFFFSTARSRYSSAAKALRLARAADRPISEPKAWDSVGAAAGAVTVAISREDPFR